MHGIQERERGIPPETKRREEEEGGENPEQRPTVTSRRGREGPNMEIWTGRGSGNGAPPPAGGRGIPEDQARDIVNDIINTLRGEEHLVAKTRNPEVNRSSEKSPDKPKGTGGVEEGEATAEAEEGVVKQGDNADPPPPPRGEIPATEDP